MLLLRFVAVHTELLTFPSSLEESGLILVLRDQGKSDV